MKFSYKKNYVQFMRNFNFHENILKIPSDLNCYI